MKFLFILNEAPYGNEHTYNGLRLAGSLSKREGVELKVFLIGDAVSGAHRGQKVPSGYYNVATMLAALTRHACPIGVCGSCIRCARHHGCGSDRRRPPQLDGRADDVDARSR